jgi:hypothetical protein
MKLPLFLSKSHLKNCRQYGIVIRISCYFYSGSWIAIEILSHFIPAFGEWSRGNLWLLSAIAVLGLLIGISRFLHKCAKMLSVSQRLSATDTSIEIRVDDLFNIEGAFVISTSTTFDTDMSDSSVSESVQEQFTRKYYGNTEHLDHDIEKELEDREYTVIEDNRRGKKKRYKIGTVVKLQLQEQITYLVAAADMNEHGRDSGSLEDMRKGLGNLWDYIGERGELVPLVMPVLGMGHARINVPREKMIREIISSFIAACSEKKFCEKLTIVVWQKDYREHDINLQKLGDYLQHLCEYTDIRNKTDTGAGEAIY